MELLDFLGFFSNSPQLSGITSVSCVLHYVTLAASGAHILFYAQWSSICTIQLFCRTCLWCWMIDL